MDRDPPDLTETKRAWVRNSEQLWTQAHRVAEAQPGIDAGDVYHTLRCLELSPSERLARGLSRGRLCAREHPMDTEVASAARDAGGFFVSGFGMQPPAFGGEGFGRLDIVLTANGLRAFSEELEHANECEIDGISIRVLGLERVLAGKRAAGRPKDLAAGPYQRSEAAFKASRLL